MTKFRIAPRSRFLSGLLVLALAAVGVGLAADRGAAADAPVLVIDEVVPPVAFPDAEGRYDVTLRSKQLRDRTGRVMVAIEAAAALPACGMEGVVESRCVSVTLDPVFGEVTVRGIPADYGGARRIKLWVEGFTESPPKEFVLSKVGPSTPRVITMGLVAGAVLLLVALPAGLRRARKGRKPTGLAPIGWMSLLTDEVTGSYSLSKVQLLAWSAAATVSYLYLVLCKTLVQGSVIFPDVPENLRVLFGLATGTSLATAGLVSLRGSQGAEGDGPRPSDLIMHGGVVAMERVQFVAFTLIGVIGFVLLTFSYEPAMIRGLPDVPDSLWQLTGLSALGYLGGKAIRPGGPVATTITTELDPAAPIVTVAGAGIHAEAIYDLRPSGEPNLPGAVRLRIDPRVPPASGRSAIRAEPVGDGSTAQVSKVVLDFREAGDVAGLIAKAGARPLVLRITNPDGQFAERTITVKATADTGQQAAAGGAVPEG
ncbi:hypothetical protein [Chthonobacter rhizosphaerae]|uniref:hypothetical protein n=1 Tax=Chthonobacter rhizosphaerae TaxID=2735553 RepID=UPI0015EF2963|nr:hypothetical protein [Chthonobacter rhizosphaerae]